MRNDAGWSPARAALPRFALPQGGSDFGGQPVHQFLPLDPSGFAERGRDSRNFRERQFGVRKFLAHVAKGLAAVHQFADCKFGLRKPAHRR